MPYINQKDRQIYEKQLQNLVDVLVESGLRESASCFPGHLNYLISSLIKRTYEQYIKAEVGDDGRLCYDDYNSIIGILECAKQEYYRRLIAPYETEKIEQHGDI